MARGTYYFPERVKGLFSPSFWRLISPTLTALSYPPAELPAVDPLAGTRKALAAALGALAVPESPLEKARRFNAEREAYLEEYRAAASETLKCGVVAKSRMVALELVIENRRNKVSDLHLALRVPAGLIALWEQHVAKPPPRPLRPEDRPHPQVGPFGVRIPDLLSAQKEMIASIGPPDNVGGYEYDDVCRGARVHVREVQIDSRVSAGTLCVYLPSFEEAHPFDLRYTMRAEGIPRAIEGTLRVVPEKGGESRKKRWYQRERVSKES